MRRSVFLRCLLFYLLFLLVLMGMYVPLYRLNLNMITEKSVQVSETMLYSRLKQFEYELSQTRTLSTRLSGTAALTQLSHISVPPTGKDVYKAYNALGTYATLTSLLPAGMTAGMYLSNGVAMVGEYLFYTMEEMYQFASDSRFETHAQWRAFVNDFTGPSCLFAERQITMMDRTFPALEYAVRMPLTSNSSSKLLFVFITGESVHELLSLTDLYPDTVLRLYDGNGALLLGRGDEGGQAYTWISAAIHAGYSLSRETLESALLRVRAAIDRTDSVRSRIVAGSAMSGVETLGQARKRTQILLRSTMNPMIYADDWA